jgi:DNA-binding NtrC family response regulator
LCKRATLRPDDIEFEGETDDRLPDHDEWFRDAKAKTTEAFERRYIERTLLASEGNITREAHSAGQNRRALFALLRKHRIDAALYRGTGEAAREH